MAAAAIHIVPDDNFDDFLFQDSLRDELELFLRQFALISARYSEAFASGETDREAADSLRFISMMFLHGGWLHLILNMWTLWLFGPTIEDRMGHARYLVSGLRPCGISRACHVQPDFDRARAGRLWRARWPSRLLHAAVSDGAGGRGCSDPVHPSCSGCQRNVAWWAHVGGFIAGFALSPFLLRSERRYRVYYPDQGVFGFDTKGRT